MRILQEGAWEDLCEAFAKGPFPGDLGLGSICPPAWFRRDFDVARHCVFNCFQKAWELQGETPMRTLEQ